MANILLTEISGSKRRPVALPVTSPVIEPAKPAVAVTIPVTLTPAPIISWFIDVLIATLPLIVAAPSAVNVVIPIVGSPCNPNAVLANPAVWAIPDINDKSPL